MTHRGRVLSILEVSSAALDEAAVRHLRRRSWQGQATADLGVELCVVELPAQVVASIAEAQKRQYR